MLMGGGLQVASALNLQVLGVLRKFDRARGSGRSHSMGWGGVEGLGRLSLVRLWEAACGCIGTTAVDQDGQKSPMKPVQSWPTLDRPVHFPLPVHSNSSPRKWSSQFRPASTSTSPMCVYPDLWGTDLGLRHLAGFQSHAIQKRSSSSQACGNH